MATDIRLARVARQVLDRRLSLTDYRRLRRSMRDLPVEDLHPPGAWDPDPDPAPTIACHPLLFAQHAAQVRHHRQPDGSWTCDACHPSCADCGTADVHHWWSGTDVCAGCFTARMAVPVPEEVAP